MIGRRRCARTPLHTPIDSGTCVLASQPERSSRTVLPGRPSPATSKTRSSRVRTAGARSCPTGMPKPTRACRRRGRLGFLPRHCSSECGLRCSAFAISLRYASHQYKAFPFIYIYYRAGASRCETDGFGRVQIAGASQVMQAGQRCQACGHGATRQCLRPHHAPAQSHSTALLIGGSTRKEYTV